MMDAEVVKEFAHLQEQINDLVLRAENYLIEKHNENSEAIDDITLSLLESAGK